MKTLINTLIASFAIFTLSTNQAFALQQDRVKNQERISIDLEALGAITLVDTNTQPSISELMRDCSGSQKSDLVDSISACTHNIEALNAQAQKEKEKEAYITDVRNQNRRFAGIITVILIFFFFVVGFTSPMFRRGSGKSISENSPFSLSRTMLFVWVYGIICSAGTIWGTTGKLPHWVVSVPLFLGIIFITFVLSIILERLSLSNANENRFMNDDQFTMGANNSFKPFMSIPKLQFLVFSSLHLGLLCAPAWILFSFQDLSVEVLVIQMISSMIYLGHKASKVQRVHSILFRKSTNNQRAHA